MLLGLEWWGVEMDRKYMCYPLEVKPTFSVGLYMGSEAEKRLRNDS